jgi:hypothetical protein
LYVNRYILTVVPAGEKKYKRPLESLVNVTPTPAIPPWLLFTGIQTKINVLHQNDSDKVTILRFTTSW